MLQRHPHHPPDRREYCERSQHSRDYAAQAEDFLVSSRYRAAKKIQFNQSAAYRREGVSDKARESRIRDARDQSSRQAQSIRSGGDYFGRQRIASKSSHGGPRPSLAVLRF